MVVAESHPADALWALTHDRLVLQSGGHRSSDVSSAMLEQKFLDKEDMVEFSTGSQTYSLSLKGNERPGAKTVLRCLKLNII